MVILDTNIIIDHLRQTRGESYLKRLINDHPEELLSLSVISVQELYQGQSSKNFFNEQILLATISPLRILPYDFVVAQTAGILLRDLGRPIELADAAIAATTILNNGELLTLNKKDFQGIKDLEFFRFQ